MKCILLAWVISVLFFSSCQQQPVAQIESSDGLVCIDDSMRKLLKEYFELTKRDNLCHNLIFEGLVNGDSFSLAGFAETNSILADNQDKIKASRDKIGEPDLFELADSVEAFRFSLSGVFEREWQKITIIRRGEAVNVRRLNYKRLANSEDVIIDSSAAPFFISNEEFRTIREMADLCYFWELESDVNNNHHGSFWDLEGVRRQPQDGGKRYNKVSKKEPPNNDYKRLCNYIMSLK